MRSTLIALCLLSSLALGAAPDFDAGQVWAYKTRAGEQDSTLLIEKVEDDAKLGRIYHISIFKVDLKSGQTNFTHELPHLPVSQQTLTLSCTSLVGHSEPNPIYLPGYRIWRQAFEAGRAGVYTISISEILNLTEVMLQKQAAETSADLTLVGTDTRRAPFEVRENPMNLDISASAAPTRPRAAQLGR